MKQTPKNSRPGAAPLFSLSDRVMVTTAATDQCAATGFVSSITAGWYIITLDVPDVFPKAKDGKVSARANSMTLLPAAVVTSKPAPAAIAPSARKSSVEPIVSIEDEDLDEDDDLGEEFAGCQMARQLAAARVRYAKTKRPNGSASADNADAIAKALRDFEPLEVAQLCDKVFNLPANTTSMKYAHLNNGQIRMNSGNRIRAYWKKLWADDKKVEIARVADIVGVALSDDFLDEVAILQESAGLDAIPVECIGNVGV